MELPATFSIHTSPLLQIDMSALAPSFETLPSCLVLLQLLMTRGQTGCRAGRQDTDDVSTAASLE
jgi:hypothetical protein